MTQPPLISNITFLRTINKDVSFGSLENIGDPSNPTLPETPGCQEIQKKISIYHIKRFGKIDLNNVAKDDSLLETEDCLFRGNNVIYEESPPSEWRLLPIDKIVNHFG